ncbi:hypothetical protein EXS61_01725 [Candidatus Parcubacteria bacterium]|nr:hypothetical protein [Candidatus Parcubacteria bacterium]
MFNFIEKLKTQPEQKKQAIAFFTSFFIVAIIFGVWLSVHFFSVSDDVVAIKENTSSPFQSLNENLASSFEGIKGVVADFKGEMSNLNVLINQ